MLLRSTYDTQAAYNMGKFISEIKTEAFRHHGCKIVLKNDQVISVNRVVESNMGNNRGKGGQWFYYGSVTVEDGLGRACILDASTIKDIIQTN